MSLKNLRKRSEGFTIIEVLIVLAIAGLILLIVFLAVPALQRNSRNTQRKNDVSGVLGAVQEFANNNGGIMPTVDTEVEGNFRPGFYTLPNIYLSSNPASYAGSVGTPSSAATATNLTTSSMTIVTGYKCTAGATNLPTRDAPRSVAVVYVAETQTGNGSLQCQDS
jgi:prepilin-type N-terminal cleavage/methylation domain-containing protein